MNGFRLLMLVIAAFTAGCQSTSDFQELMRKEQAKTALQKPNGVINQIQTASGLPVADNVYKRRLSIRFQPDELEASHQNTQIIRLFFKSLPETMRLSIIVSMAPSSAKEPFKTLMDSSARLQNLKDLLTEYTPHIELIYQPDMSINSAGIQVTGIPLPEDANVQ